MPGIEAANLATQELTTRLQSEGLALIDRINKPVKRRVVHKELTPEQIRENLEFEEYEKAKSLDNNKRLLDALAEWSPGFTGLRKIGYKVSEDFGNYAEAHGLPRDIANKMAANPDLVRSLVDSPMDNVDYVYALNHPKSKQAELVKNLASISPEEMKRYKEAKSIASRQDLEGYFATRYGHNAPNELAEAMRQHHILGGGKMPLPTSLPELRSKLGFDPNLPVPAEKLKSLPGNQHITKLMEEIYRHPQSHDQDVVRRLIDERSGESERGALGELLQHLEPREAALAAKEVVRPHYPIESTQVDIPAGYKGVTFADFPEESKRAHALGINLAEDYRNKGALTADQYKELEGVLKSEDNLHSQVARAAAEKQLRAQPYDRPYRQLERSLHANELEDPSMRFYQQAGNREYDVFKKKLDQSFNENLPKIRGQLGARGAGISSAASGAEARLLKDYIDTLGDRRQAMIDQYTKAGLGAINARRGHQYNTASGISNSLGQMNDMYHQQAQLASNASELDRQNLLRAQGIQDIGNQFNLSGQAHAAQMLQSIGYEKQSNDQRRLLHDKLNAEDIEQAPVRNLARIGAAVQGIQPLPVSQSTFVPPPVKEPNFAALNAALAGNIGSQTHRYLRNAPPYPTQSEEGMRASYAHGGPVSSRDMLGDYNRQLSAYEKAVQAQRQQLPRADDAAWLGIGDMAAQMALAGSREQSPAAAFGRGLSDGNDRYSDYQTNLQESRRKNVDIDKYLTEAHKDRYKTAADVEHKEAEHELDKEYKRGMLSYHNASLAEQKRYHDLVTQVKEDKAAAKAEERKAKLAKLTPAEIKIREDGYKMLGDSLKLYSRANALEHTADYVNTGPTVSYLPRNWAGALSGGTDALGSYKGYASELGLDKFQSSKFKAMAGLLAIDRSKPGEDKSPATNRNLSRDLKSQSNKTLSEAIAMLKRTGADEDEIREEIERLAPINEEGMSNFMSGLGQSLTGAQREKFEKKNPLGQAREDWNRHISRYLDDKKKNLEGNEEGNREAVQSDYERTTPQEREQIDSLFAAANNPPSNPPLGPSEPPSEGPRKSNEEGYLAQLGNLGKRAALDASSAIPATAAFVADLPHHIGNLVGIADNETPTWGEKVARGYKRAAEGIGYKEPEDRAGQLVHDIVGAASTVPAIGGAGLGLMKAGKALGSAGLIGANAFQKTGRFLGGEGITSALAGETAQLSKAIRLGGGIGGVESVLRNEGGVDNPVASSVIASIGVPLGMHASQSLAHLGKRAIGKEKVNRPTALTEEAIVEDITGGNKAKLEPLVKALRESESPIEGYNPTTVEHLELKGVHNPSLRALEQMRTSEATSPLLANQKSEGARMMGHALEEMLPQDATPADFQHALKAAYEAENSGLANLTNRFAETPKASQEVIAGKVRSGLSDLLKKAWSDRKAVSEPFYKKAEAHMEPIELTKTKKELHEYESLGGQALSESDNNYLQRTLGRLSYDKKGNIINAYTDAQEDYIKKINKELGHGWFEAQEPAKQKQLLSSVPVEEGVVPKSIGAHLTNIRGELQKRANNALEGKEWSRLRTLNKFIGSLDDDMAESIPATAKARAAYREGSKRVNEIMSDPIVERVIDKDHHGYYSRGEAAASEHFIKGKNSAEAARKLLKIAGEDHEMVSELKDFARSQASEILDKGVDPKKIESFIKQHPGAFVLDPSLKTELNNIAHQHKTISSRYGRTKSGADELIDYREPKDIISKVLGEKKKGNVAEEMLLRVRDQDKGERGLVSAVIDHMLHTTKRSFNDTFTPDKFVGYMKEHRSALRKMLNEKDMGKLEDIEKVMTARGRAAKAEGVGSPTQARLAKHKKLIEPPRTFTNKAADLIEHYIVSKTPGVKGSQFGKGFHQRRADSRARVLDELLADKNKAIEVFERSQSRGAAKPHDDRRLYEAYLAQIPLASNRS